MGDSIKQMQLEAAIKCSIKERLQYEECEPDFGQITVDIFNYGYDLYEKDLDFVAFYKECVEQAFNSMCLNSENVDYARSILDRLEVRAIRGDAKLRAVTVCAKSCLIQASDEQRQIAKEVYWN
jgi:hypothetical protein